MSESLTSLREHLKLIGEMPKDAPSRLSSGRDRIGQGNHGSCLPELDTTFEQRRNTYAVFSSVHSKQAGNRRLARGPGSAHRPAENFDGAKCSFGPSSAEWHTRDECGQEGCDDRKDGFGFDQNPDQSLDALRWSRIRGGRLVLP